MKEEIKNLENNKESNSTEKDPEEIKAELVNEVNSQADELINNEDVEKIIQSSGVNDQKEIEEAKKSLDLDHKINELNDELTDLKNETLTKINELDPEKESEEAEKIFEKLESLERAKEKLSDLIKNQEQINRLAFTESHENHQLIKRSYDVSLLEARSEIAKIEEDIDNNTTKDQLVNYQNKYINYQHAHQSNSVIKELAQEDPIKKIKIHEFCETLNKLNETISKNNPGLTIESLINDIDSIEDQEKIDQYNNILDSLENTYNELEKHEPTAVLDLIKQIKDPYLKKGLLVQAFNSDINRDVLIDFTKSQGLLDDKEISNKLYKRIESDEENTLAHLPIEETVDILKKKNRLTNTDNRLQIINDLQSKFAKEAQNLVETNQIKKAVDLAENLLDFDNKNIINYTSCLPKSLLFGTNRLSGFDLENLSQKEIDEIDKVLTYSLNNQSENINIDKIKDYLKKTGRKNLIDLKGLDSATKNQLLLTSIENLSELKEYLKENQISEKYFFNKVSVDDKNIKKIFDLFYWSDAIDTISDYIDTNNADLLNKIDQQFLNSLLAIINRKSSGSISRYLHKTNRQSLEEINGFSIVKSDKSILSDIDTNRINEYLQLTNRNINDIYHSDYFIELINSNGSLKSLFDANLLANLKPGSNSELIEKSLFNPKILANDLGINNWLSSVKKYLQINNQKNISQLTTISPDEFKSVVLKNQNLLYEILTLSKNKNDLDDFCEITGINGKDICDSIDINSIKNNRNILVFLLDNNMPVDLIINKAIHDQEKATNDNQNKADNNPFYSSEQEQQTENNQEQSDYNHTEEQKIASLKNISDCIKAVNSPEKLPAMIFDKIKIFESKYGNKGKGLIALALAAYGSENPKNFCAEMDKIEKIIDQYDVNNIPEGARVSLGFEYEVTQSIAQDYNETSLMGYKNDINIISKYANIGIGKDSVHEIANKPTFNPYLLLAEAKLMQEANLFDLNFTKYPQAARGYHLSMVGETGLEQDDNMYFLNNLLTMTNYAGVNAGLNINSTKDIYFKYADQLFENNVAQNSKDRMEIKGMSCDSIEQFEKSIITAHNAGVAIQITNEYLKPEVKLTNLNESKFPASAEELEKVFLERQLITKPFSSTKERNIFYNWIKLVNGINLAIDNHNENFIDSEFNGYCIKNGEYIETQTNYNIERNRKLVNEENLKDPNFMKPLLLDKNDLYRSQQKEFVNSLTNINNIFLKGPQFNTNSSINAGAVLETMKDVDTDEILDGSPKKSMFDNNGKLREGYYYVQGGSKEMIAHKSQILLTEFNNNMQVLYKEKDVALIDNQVHEYAN